MAISRGSDDGFTLIEMLTVMVVIAIVAAIAIPQFLAHRERAWRAAVGSDLRNAALAFYAAAHDNDGDYPVTIPAGVATSPDVTLAVGAGASASRICLEGDHAGLSDSVYYDSTAGGITTVAC